MAEETITPPEGEQKPPENTPPEDDQRVPYERFQKANQQAKEAKDRASKLERDMAELKAQIEERDQQGLPELDRERKRAEQLEKRIADAEKRAEEADQKVARTQRERWVAQAAAKQNFVDPDDAARYVDLGDIEDSDQAERAVKRVAKAKEHLLRKEDPQLPGRVLENGRTATTQKQDGTIDLDAEAQMVSDELKRFLANRNR